MNDETSEILLVKCRTSTIAAEYILYVSSEELAKSLNERYPNQKIIVTNRFEE